MILAVLGVNTLAVRIGYACDDVTVLQKAIGYLRKHAGGETVLPFVPTRNARDWLLVATPGFKE